MMSSIESYLCKSARVFVLEEERFDFTLFKAEDLAITADKELTLIGISLLTTEGVFVGTHDSCA